MRLRTCGLFKFLAAALAILALAPGITYAQWFHQPMRKATDLIHRQDPPRVTPRVLNGMTQDNSHVIVSISRQRVYLMVGPEIGIDAPVSTGKATGMTPTGKFTVLEKDQNHRSSLYGAFCDPQRRIVREGVSLHIDSAPSGTHFIGAPMYYFCRFHDAVGMHIGILPGYPASHGCVRLPAEIAPIIYSKVKVGTPVEVQP